jgi:ABC-type sugar transport system permease subunit
VTVTATGTLAKARDRILGLPTLSLVAYALVLPAITLRAGFVIGPMFQSIWLSFTNKNLTNEGRFVGLQNYLRLFSDETLINSLGFTLGYTAAAMILETALGLLVALLLMQVSRFKWLTNTLMLLPWVMAPLLAATVWKILYLEDGGILNEILRQLGLINEPVRWLSSPDLARVSVIITSVWKNLPWCALIFMAGLAAIPGDLYEASRVDGANALQRFWYVTLPMLRPSIYLILMFRGMGEAQTFEQIAGLTQGGPGTATTTLAVYAYQRFFIETRYGYGSAIAVLLLLLTATIGGYFAWRLYKANR